MIKVCLDISQIAHNGGVATYTKHLADELSKIKDIELIPLYYSLRKPYTGPLKQVKTVNLPPTLAEILFNRFRKPHLESLLGQDIDVFHSSDWVQPKTYAKKVTTYHDVVPLKYPQWSHPKIVAVHKRRLALVEQEIDQVIVVSEATKEDLVSCSKIDPQKIKVIYEAADESYKPLDEKLVEAFREKYKLPKHFLLAIGGIGARRNLEVIKEAADSLPLVITGQTITRLSDEEMPLLYNAADALVYASLYEGFGLPILEAMQCGTPVVTSNRSSMIEIAGDAAVLVYPTNAGAVRKGIKEALSQKSDLSRKGLNRAKQFSWEKTAEQTAQIYHHLYVEN